MPTMLASRQPVAGAAGPHMNQPYSEPTPPQWRATPPHNATAVPADAMDGARALDALVWAQGRPAVAAERLGLQSADSLLAAIVTDESQADRLRTVMRSFAMLRLLGLAEQMEDELMGRLEGMDNPTIVKLFTGVLQLADLMTRGSNAAGGQLNVDPREALLKYLPPEVRGALRVIQSNTMDEAIMGGGDDGNEADGDDREGAA